MSSRYSSSTYADKYKGLQPKRQEAGVQQSKKVDNDSDMWRFIGDIAPVAGTALGGLAGGAIGALGGPAGIIGGAAGGAGIGNALGQGVGGMAKNHANSLDAPVEDENQKRDEENERKEQRRAEMLSVLSSLRR